MKLELEAQEKLLALLPCLTDKQADVVRKRYGLGLEKIWKIREIALSIGKSERAVTKLIKRATERMHEKYYSELEAGKEGEFLRLISAPDILKIARRSEHRNRREIREEASLLRDNVPAATRSKFAELIKSYKVEQLEQEFGVSKNTVLSIVRNVRTANKADLDKIALKLSDGAPITATPTKKIQTWRWARVPPEIVAAYKAASARIGITGIMQASEVRRYTIERVLMGKMVKSDEAAGIMRYYETVK